MQDIVDKGRVAVVEGRMAEALEHAKLLLPAGGKWRASGLILAAQAYEEGGAGVPRDLEKAVAMYTEYTTFYPERGPWLFLASALMTKGGDDSFARAARALEAASEFEYSPGLDLGWARYYELRANPDYASSLKHYWAAARAGRFEGILGASRVLRASGRPAAALVVDVTRFIVGPIVGPIILLLIGRKARSFF